MADEAATAQAPTVQEAAPDPAPAAQPTPAPAAPDSVEALPDFAQKMIRELRAEAAANRTKAVGAEQAKQETVDAIAKALGLKGDDDPAKAAQMAAEQRDAALSEARQVKVENAILRMAARQGANAESLTDSRSFMRQLEAIDPSAEDFAAQVEAAVKEAVEKNPLLKAAPAAAPAARSGGPVGGGASVPGQLDSVEGMSPEEIVKAKSEGRLNKLLGIAS